MTSRVPISVDRSDVKGGRLSLVAAPQAAPAEVLVACGSGGILRPISCRSARANVGKGSAYAQASGGHAPGSAVVGPRRSLVPVQQWADRPITGAELGSLAGHVALVLMLLYKPHERRNGQAEGRVDQQAAEVVFEPPPRHEMTGAPSPDQGGGRPPPPSFANHADGTSASGGVRADASDVGEIIAGADKARPDRKAPSKMARRDNDRQAKRAPQERANPLAHPMDVRFSEAQTSSPSPRRGRVGGSNRPINLSTGPLSMNGQVNAPYESRSATIKGVSSEYGAEIDRWIREHLFYPEDAIENGEEGPSSVHVQLDRSGRVRRVIVTNQSGSTLLDAATYSMFSGQRLPPVPPDMKGDHFDIDVTVNYILLRD